jgi:cation transport regulator ChaB
VAELTDLKTLQAAWAIEETPNEFRYRLKDPGTYKGKLDTGSQFAYKLLKQDKPRVFGLVGKLSPDSGTSLQGFRFPRKDGWTKDDANRWAQAHASDSDFWKLSGKDSEVFDINMDLEVPDWSEAPYERTSDLPKGVKSNLPRSAQRTWLSTFNAVFRKYGNEQKAIFAAWRNVKQAGYKKGEQGWTRADISYRQVDPRTETIRPGNKELTPSDMPTIVGDVSLPGRTLPTDPTRPPDMQKPENPYQASPPTTTQPRPIPVPTAYGQEIKEKLYCDIDTPRILDATEAAKIPNFIPTPTKVYAEFRLLTFKNPNKNKDSFSSDDITSDIVKGLVGSPIYMAPDAEEHPLRDSRATERAPYQLGTVVNADKRTDGLYCVGALQREILEDRKIEPDSLTKQFAVSMEVMFDRAKARYVVGSRTLNYEEALADGSAAPKGTPDDRNKYDARYIRPTEFHAVAMLQRGRNADAKADVLRVAASADSATKEAESSMADTLDIEWADDDIEAYFAHLALNPDDELNVTEDTAEAKQLSAKARKAIPKGQFAHVDKEGKGRLPIHDAPHVRNALARLNQTGISAPAKKAALRKILAKAKKLGVKVDPKSDVAKQYSQLIDEPHMARQDAIVAALKTAFPDGAYEAIETYDDKAIVRHMPSGKTFQMPFKQANDDSIALDGASPVEVTRRYVPVQELQKSVADAEKAVAERIAKAVAEAEKVAVDKYIAAEKAFADRMKVLSDISPIPVGTDAEKAAKTELEAKVKVADEAAFASIKAERAVTALAEARKVAEKAVASLNEKAPLTLRGGAPEDKDEVAFDPYHVKVPAGAA